ncbi:MAG TPA: amidase family protein, partial [Bryobacteraceae bacterium]|nr:amidase family protein [Bryobacteraceae bacterium]
MTATNVLSLSGTEQARLIRQGEISSTELVRAHLDRIAEINPSLNAAVDILSESGLAAARAADRKRTAEMRPFEGVPFSIKDSIEVEGTVCSAGTLGYRASPPSKRDATLVARLRNAGAIPLARTNLPDLLFAFESDNLIFGRTNNPYDLTRSSGGSSGGEAALIAAGGSPFGLGSDAAGSVRLPAHYSGIASIKPTSGCLPRTGHVPPAGGWIEMLWQMGPMARRVEDLRAMLGILAGPDGQDYTVKGSPGAGEISAGKIRVAFFANNGVMPPDPDTAAVLRNAVNALETAGFAVEEARPACIERSYELEMKILGADGGDGLRQFLESIGSHRTHPLLEGWLRKLEPYRTTLQGFANYWAELDRFRSEMFAFMNRYDAILSPVAARP